MMDYILYPLTLVSRTLNTLRGGDPSHTLCYEAALGQNQWGWWIFGTIVEFIHPGHLAWALMIEKKLND